MQTRRQSFEEALFSTLVGFFISQLWTAFLIWALNIPMNHNEQLIFVGTFTLLSVLRSYVLRRFFNWYHNR